MLIVTRNIYNKQVVFIKNGGSNNPVATAATNVNGDSFTANWDAYPGATMYFLDVSTDPNFATYILQNQAVTAPTTSYNVTGLTGCTTYYYRVRALVGTMTYSLSFNDFLNSGYYSTYFY